MAKPRKTLTKVFKAELIQELGKIYPYVDQMRKHINSPQRINEYLTVLHGMFSHIELKVRARDQEVNQK